MICLIASSYINARKWAASQHLEDDEWFYPKSSTEIMIRKNFHTIVVLDGIEHVSNAYLDTLYTLAKKQGRIGRAGNAYS